MFSIATRSWSRAITWQNTHFSSTKVDYRYPFNAFHLFRPLDDSVHGSPVPTPVVTPTSSPRSSSPPVRTPEASEQELPDSEKTGVATPELTVSSQKSPDEDLKEYV